MKACLNFVADTLSRDDGLVVQILSNFRFRSKQFTISLATRGEVCASPGAESLQVSVSAANIF